MSAMDYFTLILYVIGLFAISTASAKRNTNHKEMFSANRSSPWWASGLSGFMTMFSAGTFVVWGGIAYEHGMVAVVINICYGIAALMAGFLVAKRWNRMGVSTPAEYVQMRFGSTGLHFFTWTMLLKRILGVSVSLYALAIILVAIIPMPVELAIAAFGTIVVLYTMQGGLWAVLMTDVLQFIVLTVVVFMVSLLMLNNMDGLSQFSNNVPEGFFSPVSNKYSWFFLCGWVIINFFIIGAEWAFVQRFIAVKSPGDAVKASCLFGFMYLLTPLFWFLPPLLYRGQVSGINKEQAYILASQSVLPPGLLGLMIAAMFSATASMVSSQLNVFAGVLTNDFYKPLLNPEAGDKKLVKVGRVFTLILGTMLTLTAISVPYMGGAEKLIISINSLLVVPLFAPTLWGLFSKKIGLRQMIQVVSICFGTGLVLRFGVAANPWIVEGQFLWSLKQTLSSNSTNLELVIGVFLPLMLLSYDEFRLRGENAGAKLVFQKTLEFEKSVTTSEKNTSFDPWPVKMVMFSLMVLGVWILLIAILMAGSDWNLIITALALLIASCGIQMMLLRHKNRLHREEVSLGKVDMDLSST